MPKNIQTRFEQIQDYCAAIAQTDQMDEPFQAIAFSALDGYFREALMPKGAGFELMCPPEGAGAGTFTLQITDGAWVYDFTVVEESEGLCFDNTAKGALVEGEPEQLIDWLTGKVRVWLQEEA